MEPKQLTIESQPDRDGVRLIVCGEVDLASTSLLERELRDVEENSSRIVLDLAGLEFIDSAGLSCLLRAQERAKANGRELLFTGVRAQALRLFQLTGFDVKFGVEPPD